MMYGFDNFELVSESRYKLITQLTVKMGGNAVKNAGEMRKNKTNRLGLMTEFYLNR